MKRIIRPGLPRLQPPMQSAQTEQREKRRHVRFDQLFTVELESPLHGNHQYVARNISEGGLFLESREPLPLGSPVRIRFTMPNGMGEIVAHGEVRHHYYLNYADAKGPQAVVGMGIRFVGFEESGAVLLHGDLSQYRVLH